MWNTPSSGSASWLDRKPRRSWPDRRPRRCGQSPLLRHALDDDGEVPVADPQLIGQAGSVDLEPPMTVGTSVEDPVHGIPVDGPSGHNHHLPRLTALLEAPGAATKAMLTFSGTLISRPVIGFLRVTGRRWRVSNLPKLRMVRVPRRPTTVRWRSAHVQRRGERPRVLHRAGPSLRLCRTC